MKLVIEQMKNLKSDRREDCPISIISMDRWEWPQGVGLFALYLVYKDTKDAALLAELQAWFDARISEGLPSKNVNTMCPMLTLAYLAEETGNESYLGLCREWAEHVMSGMPRTEEGGLQHIVSGGENRGELWDDTLYMTVLFLAKMGVMIGRDDYIQESIRQFLVHLKYLTDPETGLFFHGWTFEGNHHFARARWARGNAWYTAGLVDYLEIVSLPAGVEQFLLSSLERQVNKLVELQAEDGMWHTLLDDADSYVETSATSAFVYGILKAVRKGYLPDSCLPAAHRGFEAVLRQMDDDGVVHQVSYGTAVGRTLQAYRDIPICPMPYGQSMALLMMVEGLKH
jgi:unsaturated rhamnogalacturonyl hydrolase